MNVSSSLSFQSNVDRSRPSVSKRSLDDVTEGGFKTSNPQIFPSLHPLSPFYRERTKALPSPAFKTPKTIKAEPVKKVKMNNESETIAVKEFDETKSYQESTKTEKKEKDLNNSSTLEEFRVPKRPARFDVEKKKTNVVPEPLKKLTLDQLHEQFKSSQEPLVVPDTVLDGLKALQTKNVGFLPRKAVETKNLPVKEHVVQSSSRIPEPIKPSLVNQNQGNGLLGLGFGQVDLKSIYNKLEVEYLSTKLIEQAPHLFRICQQNQQKLSQNLRFTPINQERSEVQDEIFVDSPTSDEDTQAIKEENVKQEIQC